MNGRIRIILSIFVMTAVVIGSISLSLFSLYRAALKEEGHRLQDAVQGQAGMMEAMARFNARHLNGKEFGQTAELTFDEIGDAFGRLEGFGRSGEFILAKRNDEKIVFLVSRHPENNEHPKSVPLSLTLKEPIRRALSGESGTIITMDHRGKKILAAYQPVGTLGFGLVAKMDLDEIRLPFVRAALLTAGGAICFVLIGSAFFWNLTRPLLRRLKESEVKYRSIFENSPNSIFLMTDVFEDCNEEACRLWACQREDIVGHSPWEFSPLHNPTGRIPPSKPESASMRLFQGRRNSSTGIIIERTAYRSTPRSF